MSNDELSGNERHVDEIARSAGAALRRSAPPDGIARVRSDRRRRQTMRAVAGVSAAVVVAAGALLVINRGDNESVVTDLGPGVVPSAVVTTTAPATTIAPTTIAPATTAAPAVPSGWESTTEAFPSLASIACCGQNWEGDPSPAVPSDPAAPLAPGIYNLRRLGNVPADDFGDGVLTLELRPYTRCAELDPPVCSEPYADTDLGVPNDPARVIDVVLDDTVRVAVSGFACENDQLQRDARLGTGVEVAAWAAELDAAYETAVAAPLRSGVDPEQIAAGVAEHGFYDPDCLSYTDFAWTPSSGPGILTPLYLDTPEGMPPPSPLASASGAFISPDALAVDERGDYTLYLYAGFRS